MQNNEIRPNFETMSGSSCPFSPEGLTVDEIESFYREARDKNEAVTILADCCDTYHADMARFLSERGLISGVKPSDYPGETERERKYREKVAKVLSFAEQGFTCRETAEVMGIPYDSVRTIATRNAISFSGNTKKAREQKGEKEMEKKVHIELPERDYEAKLKELTARCEDLNKQLEAIREAHRETVENYEKAAAREANQTDQIRFLKKKLEDSELARNRLEGQMEVVRMFLGESRRF